MCPISGALICSHPSYRSSVRLAVYVLTIAVYLTVTIPSLRTIVDPVAGVDTRDDQIEAMRVLSAGNTIMVILLVGVLLLQVRTRV